MVSDPNEKLIGQFSSRSFHVHLSQIDEGYRMDAFDKDDAAATMIQSHYSDLQNAQIAFCMKVQELLASA